MHMHTYIHIYIRTYIHTYIHTYMDRQMNSQLDRRCRTQVRKLNLEHYMQHIKLVILENNVRVNSDLDDCLEECV